MKQQSSIAIPERPLLGNEVYDRLLSDIVSQKLPPDSRLQVDALSRMLEVSQTPIRQALIRLQAEGLVINKRNAGYSVAPLPSKEWFMASLEYRLIVEPAAARLAAEHITADRSRELKRVLDQMEACTSGGYDSYGTFAAIDLTFHGLIAAFSENEVVARSLDDVRRRMVVFRMSFPEELRLSLQSDHRKIYEAIAAQQPGKSYDAMHAHISSTITWLAAVE